MCIYIVYKYTVWENKHLKHLTRSHIWTVCFWIFYILSHWVLCLSFHQYDTSPLVFFQYYVNIINRIIENLNICRTLYYVEYVNFTVWFQAFNCSFSSYKHWTQLCNRVCVFSHKTRQNCRNERKYSCPTNDSSQFWHWSCV